MNIIFLNEFIIKDGGSVHFHTSILRINRSNYKRSQTLISSQTATTGNCNTPYPKTS